MSSMDNGLTPSINLADLASRKVRPLYYYYYYYYYESMDNGQWTDAINHADLAARQVPELAMARAALERFRQARPPGVYKVSVTPLPFVHSRRGTRLRAEFHSRRGTD